MVHVTPVPHAPSIPRQKPQYSGGKGKGSGLAVHVSTVAAQLGSTITGWLVSELTTKSAQGNLNSSKTSTPKRGRGEVAASSTGPKAVFYTPKDSGPPSPGHLTIPLGGKIELNEGEDVKSEDDQNNEEINATVDMPRPPPPARMSPPPVPVDSFHRNSPVQFTESLPIAPQQLLPPVHSVPMKSISQRKPTPIHIVKPPTPKQEIDHLPKLS